MASGTSPTVRRRRLGAELRKLREHADILSEAAAESIGCSQSKISRMETGRAPCRVEEVLALLDLYEIIDVPRREELLALARASHHKGWWNTFDDVVRRGFDTYVGLEGATATISVYESQVVVGLLQTPEYAREILRATDPHIPDKELDRSVAFRMERQHILARQDAPPLLWAVMDEAALRRRVGGSVVMRDQLRHIMDVVDEQPNVTVQVLPYGAGAYAGQGFPFTILGFPDPDDPDVVYVEGLSGDLYLEKMAEVRRYRFVQDHLRVAALTPDRSRELMTIISKEMT
jgi:hypothetical protein